MDSKTFDTIEQLRAFVVNRAEELGFAEARFGGLMPTPSGGFEIIVRVRESWEESIYDSPSLYWKLEPNGTLIAPRVKSRAEREMRFILQQTAAFESMAANDKFATEFARAFVAALVPKLDEARKLLTAATE